MRKFILLFILFGISFSYLAAAKINSKLAAQTASVFAQKKDLTSSDMSLYKALELDGNILAYVYLLAPKGYVIISADDTLPPVLAYSEDSSFENSKDSKGILEEMICYDLKSRLDFYNSTAMNAPDPRWEQRPTQRDFVQYPPAGYSPTGGWLKTNWTQNAPYNNFCPIDPITNIRSIAGCPSVAMAMILNYHETTQSIEFNDSDDYYHNYAGRNFQIDDDYQAHGFASFPELNTYLSDLSHHYRYMQPITNTDKAALVWACGIACKQIYTSSGSGTFSVNQAYAGFQRFGFTGCELLDDTDADVYTRIATNIMEAKPVHLAVVTPAWDSGHNVVVDGYNTDNYFHLNFGWGGSYNGWYLLPSEIPYNLTVLEGAIVDIVPNSYLFAFPDTLEYLSYENTQQSVEILNTSDIPITVEAYNFPEFIGASRWEVSITPDSLPYTLNPGESMFFHLSVDFPVRFQLENIVEETLRIIFSHGVMNITVRFDTDLITANADDTIPITPISILCSPNPFRQDMSISITSAKAPIDKVFIYNMKGQKVHTLKLQNGHADWNGKCDEGMPVPKGIYLIKVPEQHGCKRIVKM